MMDCHWIKTSPSLSKGITIINQLDDTRFEQFLRRIVVTIQHKNTDIFTEDEREKLEKIFKIDQENLLLAIKTILYLFKRLLKYIFMPVDLKNNLKSLGFNNEKSDFIVKLWSTETRTTLNELGSDGIDKNKESPNFSWKLNAELSSDCCKKIKIPKAYLLFSRVKDEVEIEMTHTDMYSMFLQFESVQNELDTLGI